MWVPKLGCVHPWLIKKYQNCFRIAITFPNILLLYMPVENCLPALFDIICRYTAEHSLTIIISSNVSLCSMTFCYGRRLSSKVSSFKENLYLKTSLWKTTFHVVHCVFWRSKWIPTDQDKLSYRFYLHKISLLIDNLSLHIIFSCNLLNLGYTPGIEQSRMLLNKIWKIYKDPITSTLKWINSYENQICCFYFCFRLDFSIILSGPCLLFLNFLR